MVKKIILKSMVVITSLLLHFNLSAQTSLTVNVATAGTLPTLIDSIKMYQITDLTLTGNLNGTDIRFIREMTGLNYNGTNNSSGILSILNLSGANIVSGGSPYYTYYQQGYSGDPFNGNGRPATTTYYYTSNNTLPSSMFYNNVTLKKIILPNSVTYIEESAFYGCTGLTNVTIGNSVTTIGDAAFEGCTGLTSITIPNSVTSIQDYAFYGCTGLTNVTIGNSVTTIGDAAFKNCTRLTSITIPNSVTSIGWGETGVGSTFEGCTGLTSVTIGNSVTLIGEYVFQNCTGLTNVTIGNSVTTIGSGCFEGCTGLTSITIPNSVTSIQAYAFDGCTGLTAIYSKNPTPPKFSTFASGFDNVSTTTCKLYVPKGSAAAYKAAWGFTNIIETDFTAINPINKDNATINSFANGIYIETNIQTLVSIYNLSGQKVYQSVINVNTEIPLNKGIYIVRVNNESEKVIVK